MYDIPATAPKVSVIIPTFNRKAYVQEAIDSVLAQTYLDYEVIVVDDGSTDGTEQALRGRYGDRIRYRWQENQGESVARNCALEMSSGQYIGLLDSDDLWFPEKLEKQVAVLQRSSDAALVFAQTCLIDSNGRRMDLPPVGHDIQASDLTLESLCVRNAMGSAASTAMVRRSHFEEAGGYDESIQYGEDWDLWLRLRQLGPFVLIDEPLASMRVHLGSQWHFPRPESLDRRLEDHLRVLDKAFSAWPGKVPTGLRARSLANHYALLAFMDYVIGRPEIAQRRLAKAIELDPEHWSDSQLFLQKLRDQTLAITALKKEPHQVTMTNVSQAFGHWPAELLVSGKWKAHALGQICLALMFTNYTEQDLIATRFFLLRAIRYAPTSLLNLGVWSIAIEALLGSRVASRMRSGTRLVRSYLVPSSRRASI